MKNLYNTSDTNLIEALERTETRLQQLQASQELLTHAINTIPDPIFVKDECHRFIIVNRAACQLMGKSAEEIIGKSDYNFFPKEQADIFHEKDKLVFATMGENENEEELTDGEGNLRIISTRKTVFKNADGSKILVGIIRDVTKYKRQEEALQLSEQRLQMALQGSALGLWDWNIVTGDVYYDFYFKRMLGYRVEEIENSFQSWEKLVHPEDLPQTIVVLKAYLAGRIPTYAVEFRMQSKSGEWRWILSHAKATERDQNGNPIRMTGTHKDVTDRKLAEETLTRFREAIEATTDAIGIADVNGNHFYQNQAFSELFEYETPEQFMAAGGPRIVFSNSDVAQEVLTAIINGKSWVGEVEQISRTGRRIQMLLRANPIKDAQGKMVGLVAIHTDISERKQAEKAALRLTKNLQTAQRIAHIGNWEFNLATRKITWSEELFRIYGLEIGQAPTFEELREKIHPEDRDTLRQAVEKAIADGTSYSIDYRIYQPNGEIRYINSRGEVILDRSGKISKLFGTAIDISDRKQAEIALQQQLQREKLVVSIQERIRQSLNLEEVLKTAAEEVRHFLHTDRTVIYQFHPEASGEIAIESVGEEWMPTLGMDIQDKCFCDTYIPLYQQGRIKATENIHTAGFNPCHANFLAQIQVKANLVVPILQEETLWGLLIAHECRSTREWHNAEIESLRQLSVQLAIAIQQSTLFAQAQTEIAERKLAEAALQQSEAREREKAQQLEITLQELKSTQTQLVQNEKMAGLGQLVAGVAHEINNPINFIYGNVTPALEYASDLLNLISLYQSYYPQPDVEIENQIAELDLEFLKRDFLQLLNSMKTGADRIKEIVLSLRSFSRLDEAEMKAADLHAGIDSTLMILQHRLREQPNRVAIEVVKEFGNLPLVECYPGQLNQVFMNIFSNAIDALEEKLRKDLAFIPQISIHTELRHREDLPMCQYVVICIGDNGTGISPDVKDRLFDPFFTTKPVGKGTGLGLSISYQIIVEKHQGTLKCNSQLGKGTEFVMEIPTKARNSDD